MAEIYHSDNRNAFFFSVHILNGHSFAIFFIQAFFRHVCVCSSISIEDEPIWLHFKDCKMFALQPMINTLGMVPVTYLMYAITSHSDAPVAFLSSLWSLHEKHRRKHKDQTHKEKPVVREKSTFLLAAEDWCALFFSAKNWKRFSCVRFNKSFFFPNRIANIISHWTLPAGFMRRAIFQKAMRRRLHMQPRLRCTPMVLLLNLNIIVSPCPHPDSSEYQHIICTISQFKHTPMRPSCLLSSVISLSCDVVAVMNTIMENKFWGTFLYAGAVWHFEQYQQKKDIKDKWMQCVCVIVVVWHWYDGQINEMAFIKRICSIWQQFKYSRPIERRNTVRVVAILQFECFVASGTFFYLSVVI